MERHIRPRSEGTWYRVEVYMSTLYVSIYKEYWLKLSDASKITSQFSLGKFILLIVTVS